jgi:ribonuclease Z
MSKVIILGTSNAIPTVHAENTHMAIVGDERVVLVDSASNPVVRLEQAEVDLNSLTDIIITHFHPDHASGVPLLLMDMWLLGREKPLNVHGLDYTLERIEGLMDFYNWKKWPNFFPVHFNKVPMDELYTLMDCSDFTIKSSPVHHMVPNIGLRVEFKSSGKVMAYSCDTEPCDEVVRLSDGADVLIHEATGESIGHSSAQQAGETARRAEAGRLYLIHYNTGKGANPQQLISQAASAFQGEIRLTKDFMTLDFSKRMPLSHLGRGSKHVVIGDKKTNKLHEP